MRRLVRRRACPVKAGDDDLSDFRTRPRCSYCYCIKLVFRGFCRVWQLGGIMNSFNTFILCVPAFRHYRRHFAARSMDPDMEFPCISIFALLRTSHCSGQTLCPHSVASRNYVSIPACSCPSFTLRQARQSSVQRIPEGSCHLRTTVLHPPK